MADRPALLSSGLRTMPASRRRPAAKRVATPIASGCKSRCVPLARRPVLFASRIARRRLALRIGAGLWARHARANEWQQITKQLAPQPHRVAEITADDEQKLSSQ